MIEDEILAQQAERDFQRMRNQAFWSGLWGRLRGQSSELLSFDEVRSLLRLNDEHRLGLQLIPVDHIVGSVGRYKDFTRKFLPKASVNKERWKAVDALNLGATGIPPIEVYKVGSAYFVLDGNHRVSVARANGMTHIEAYVTEFRTEVPFELDTLPDDLALKAEYAAFLRETRLKAVRPESEDILLTERGRYPEIVEHIHCHQYYLGLDCDCCPTWIQAVGSWYDKVYLPMINAIRESNVMAEFPDRQAADLYVWLIKHQGEMHEAYGTLLSPEDTIGDFLEKIAS
jgi:hypothetical protein